ncbi:Histone-lysine N-methyltransferase set-1 [Holothuria leucospilota]|uniref:Histone-lysine N-methyltransferase set-1 n=1 Tax=Holothuria leucospilota TaxID=206669 RepID=A0A9Q1B9V8_HOLLE|nr:Histone-lysine N-methyltransferase set-1 [Holothuria leucospilota]
MENNNNLACFTAVCRCLQHKLSLLKIVINSLNESSLSGKGVFALKEFAVGDFLFEYAGVLKTSEEVYGKDQTYIFHFKEDGKSLCIDATESNRLGKYANDDWLRPNAIAKKIKAPGGHPALALFCLRPIRSGQEIRYDYGQPESEWRMKQTSELLGKVDEGDSRDDDELSGKNLIRLLQVEVNGQLKGNE